MYHLERMERSERSELFYDCLREAKLEAYEDDHISQSTWDWFTEVQKFSRNSSKYPALSRDSIGRVSFARTLEEKDDDNRRVKLTLNKFLRRQCGELSDNLNNGLIAEDGVETVCNIFQRIVVNLTTSPENLFKVIPVQQIPDFLASIKESCGVEMGSCMTGDPDLSDAYRIFEKAEGVKLECLVFDDGTGRNEHGKARAFLWTLDDGEVLMDRIYNNSGYHLSHFKEYARSRGIWQRTHQGLPDDSTEFRKGDDYTGNATFKIPFPDCMPYMDSFSWATESRRELRMQLTSSGADLIFQSTSGGWDRCGVRCVCCIESFDPSDTHEVDCDHYCSDCYHDHFAECVRCGEREAIDEAHIVSGESWCQYCADHHADECGKCLELYPFDQLEKLEEGRVCDCCRNN